MSREYPAHPLVGLGVVLFRGPDVLLVRRAKPPNAGVWSLPGGAQELGETAEAGTRRELLEETGVTAGPLLLVAHVDIIQRDLAGRVQYHYTILDFAGDWAGGAAIARDDVAAIRWANISQLEQFGLPDKTLQVISLARQLSSGAGTERPVS